MCRQRGARCSVGGNLPTAKIAATGRFVCVGIAAKRQLARCARVEALPTNDPKRLAMQGHAVESHGFDRESESVDEAE